MVWLQNKKKKEELWMMFSYWYRKVWQKWIFGVDDRIRTGASYWEIFEAAWQTGTIETPLVLWLCSYAIRNVICTCISILMKVIWNVSWNKDKWIKLCCKIERKTQERINFNKDFFIFWFLFFYGQPLLTICFLYGE